MSGQPTCLLHQALALGLTVHPSSGARPMLVSGPSGTESLGEACYRARARINAILHGLSSCGCGSSSASTDSVDKPYRFGRFLSPTNGPFTYAEYSRLVDLKRTLSRPEFAR